MVVRRFVLVQGAEQKLRPIDDCLEAQLNMVLTSASYLKLQDVDYIASLALKVAEAVSTGQQKHGSGEWTGKRLELSKAYQQMGIHPSDRHLAVIYFAGEDGLPRYFLSDSLMFGATAAVYRLNRVSKSSWWLLNQMLLIPCGVFYDDYPLFLRLSWLAMQMPAPVLFWIFLNGNMLEQVLKAFLSLLVFSGSWVCSRLGSDTPRYCGY